MIEKVEKMNLQKEVNEFNRLQKLKLYQEKIDRILTAVIIVHEVPKEKILRAKTRGTQEQSDAKSMAIRIIKEQCKLFSLKEIGIIFGGMDHSSIIHCIGVSEDLTLTDKIYRGKYNRILGILSLPKEEIKEENKLIIKPSHSLDLDVYNELRSAM
jgi:chromosomal replication initiation ATPase DnaA